MSRSVAAACTAQVAQAVAEVDPGQWSALHDQDELYSSYSWLTGLDNAGEPAPVVMVRSGGPVVAALPLWPRQPVRSDLFDLPQMCAGLPGPWCRPFLWAGARRSTRNCLLCRRDVDRSAALRCLLDASADYAADRDLSGVVVPYLSVTEARELAGAHPDARLVLHSADAVIAVPQGGLEEYLARASKSDRDNRKNELARFIRAGGRLRWCYLDQQLADHAADLIAQNRAKYGNDDGAGYVRRILDGHQRAGLWRRTALCCCHVGDGSPCALSMELICGETLYVRYFGADYHSLRPPFTYFMACCYAPLDFAALTGLRRLHLSVSALDAKVRRGALLSPNAAVVLVVRSRPPSTKQVLEHNRRFAAEVIRRYSARPGALNHEWDVLSRKEGTHATSGLHL